MSVHLNQQVLTEIGVRVMLWTTFLWLERFEPILRKIQPSEVWLYQYPVVGSYVSSTSLWCIVFIIPTTCILFNYGQTKNKVELREACLSLSLNYGINGLVTQFLKLTVGRPRPNFYNRCFPDGSGTDFEKCTGSRSHYMDGRKSFPSGHSSFAFSSMFFLSLYLAGKLKIFSDRKGESWRLCVCMLPLMLAAAVAVSRTCDYHHHYEDVAAGSLLGSIVAYICYRQHYPSIYSSYSNIPYALKNQQTLDFQS